MLLKNQLIKQGQLYFKYRGHLPIILVVICLATILLYPVKWDKEFILIFQVSAITLIFYGHYVRATTVGRRFKHSSGRNRSHHYAEELNFCGWYSMTRNPLYFGNFCIWIGLSMLTLNILLVLFSSVFFWFIYVRIILSEEDYLAEKFGESYKDWASSTSVFFPYWKTYRKNTIPISYKTILKNEYPGISATLTCVLLILVTLSIKKNGAYIFESWQLFFASAIAIFASSMKLLKRKTKFFNLED